MKKSIWGALWLVGMLFAYLQAKIGYTDPRSIAVVMTTWGVLLGGGIFAANAIIAESKKRKLNPR